MLKAATSRLYAQNGRAVPSCIPLAYFRCSVCMDQALGGLARAKVQSVMRHSYCQVPSLYTHSQLQLCVTSGLDKLNLATARILVSPRFIPQFDFCDRVVACQPLDHLCCFDHHPFYFCSQQQCSMTWSFERLYSTHLAW